MEVEPRVLEIVDWGTVAYPEAWARQLALVDERLNGAAPDRLVFAEHPPVVTYGRSAAGRDLPVPEEKLREQGIAVVRTDRGGLATYHGPGQMVAYPVLEIRGRDIIGHVRRLLETVADVLLEVGLQPELRQRTPGVWVRGAKIASVGIAVRKSVSYHGVALNVNTDLWPFSLIVPCGNPAETMTSLERELGRPVTPDEAKTLFLARFKVRFGYGRVGRQTGNLG